MDDDSDSQSDPIKAAQAAMVVLQGAAKAGLAVGLDPAVFENVQWKEDKPAPMEEDESAAVLHRKARNCYSTAFGKWQKAGGKHERAAQSQIEARAALEHADKWVEESKANLAKAAEELTLATVQIKQAEEKQQEEAAAAKKDSSPTGKKRQGGKTKPKKTGEELDVWESFQKEFNELIIPSDSAVEPDLQGLLPAMAKLVEQLKSLRGKKEAEPEQPASKKARGSAGAGFDDSDLSEIEEEEPSHEPKKSEGKGSSKTQAKGKQHSENRPDRSRSPPARDEGAAPVETEQLG
jgi:hypothetical protein